MSDVISLLTARTTTGNGDAVHYPGGDALLEVDGTWGGTSFKLQRSRDGAAGTYRDLDSSVTFTANTAVVVSLPPGFYRAVLTGGTARSVPAALSRIPS